MEFGLLQEDLFQKQLWDISAFTNSIAWSAKIGTVATMTKNTIHLHTPQFKYMSAYQVRWLLIDKKSPQCIEPPASATDNVTSLTNFLLEHNMREGNVSFRSIHWSENIVSNHNYAPLLMVLLTDGTVLFVDTCNKSMVQTKFGVDFAPTTGSDQTYTLSYLDDSSYSLKLRECSISLDCAIVYKQYCQRAGLNLFKHRVRCIADHYLAASDANIVCFAACDRVTIWQIFANEAGALQISLLAECILSDCKVDTNVTTLLVFTLVATSTTCAVLIVCGTNDGEAVTFELKLTQNASSPSVGPVYNTNDVNSRLAGRVKISDAPIDKVQMSTDSVVNFFVGAEMHAVSLTTLVDTTATTNSTDGTVSTRLYAYGAASAFETLPDLRALTTTNDSGSTTSSESTTIGVLTSSTAGLLSTWSVNPTADASALTLDQTLLNRAKSYPIVGASLDPTKLAYTYLYKTPAMHSNSREVQLNIALRNPRAAIAINASPFVAQDFAASVLSTARVLLYVIYAHTVHTSGTVKVPLSGLVLAYLQSLETDQCKQYYRTLIPNLPNDVLGGESGTTTDKSKRKRTGNSANSSDSESASENDEDSDIEEATPSTQPLQPKQTVFLHKDQQLQKLQQRQAKSTNSGSDSEDESNPRSASKSSAKKPRKFLASQTRVRNTAKLYDRIEQLARPGAMEAVTLSVGTLFDAAVCVAYSLSNSNGNNQYPSSRGGNDSASMEVLSSVDANVCDIVKEMDLGDKIEALFSFPAEGNHLLLYYVFCSCWPLHCNVARAYSVYLMPVLF